MAYGLNAVTCNPALADRLSGPLLSGRRLSHPHPLAGIARALQDSALSSDSLLGAAVFVYSYLDRAVLATAQHYLRQCETQFVSLCGNSLAVWFASIPQRDGFEALMAALSDGYRVVKVLDEGRWFDIPRHPYRDSALYQELGIASKDRAA
jgi:hypothetical protein